MVPRGSASSWGALVTCGQEEARFLQGATCGVLSLCEESRASHEGCRFLDVEQNKKQNTASPTRHDDVSLACTTKPVAPRTSPKARIVLSARPIGQKPYFLWRLETNALRNTYPLKMMTLRCCTTRHQRNGSFGRAGAAWEK